MLFQSVFNGVLLLIHFIINYLHTKFFSTQNNASTSPVLSVNYHISRKCNYACEFCFHTAKTSNVLASHVAEKGLRLLKQEGLKKINFAGGEPFLYPKLLGKLVQFSKQELKLESVSIVTNGSKAKEKWFQEYGQYVDIVAVSCDSFNEQVNKKIGRGSGKHLEFVRNIKTWCDRYRIKFKINTVVCKYNVDEDMSQQIMELKPFRWKVFQVLELKGENSGEKEGSVPTLRDVRSLLITNNEFKHFVDVHKHVKELVPESNDLMQNSYLILDENMAFLNCSEQGKVPSESILRVGVANALKQAGFDQQKFLERGGKYQWSKTASPIFTGDVADNVDKLQW